MQRGGHSETGHEVEVKGSTNPATPVPVHFLEPRLPSRGHTSHPSPFTVFLCFYLGVVKNHSPKAPHTVGRIWMHFLICCDSVCARTFQQGVLGGKLSVLQKGSHPKSKHQPHAAIPRARCRERLQPLLPEACFLSAASVHLHCQLHLAAPGSSRLQDKGPTVPQAQHSPGMGTGTEAFILIFLLFCKAQAVFTET